MKPALIAFNRGRISPLALARTDFKRTALSADEQTNWRPRALGSMMLRPGYGYTGASRNNLFSVSLPFVFARNDTARLELTDGKMRVWVDDGLQAFAATSTVITNGTFNTDLSGWTDLDGGAAVSDWKTSGYMSLAGDGNAEARRRQEVSVSGADIGKRHGLKLTIERGPVSLRVGSTAGDDDLISETVLRSGSHVLGFTPGGNVWIDLFTTAEASALIDSVAIHAATALEIDAPWAEADLRSIRWDQSGDVVFCACPGYRQRRIERRADDSWSIVLYESATGPFMLPHTGNVTITPSTTTGDISLTASRDLFAASQIGALFRLTHSGQLVQASLSGANQWSDPIRVTGIDGSRIFAVIISGTWSATVTLQYSVGDPGDWVDATSGTYTSNTSISYDDTLDNQVIWYRIGIKTGNYTSGTADASLSYSSGSQTGIARVTDYVSETVVSAAVLEPFGGIDATSDWSESYWSFGRGYPSSVGLYEGRLWWAGKDRVWGSQSDAYSGFDDETEGDSGPISRSIGSGPVDRINWLVPMQRLLLGAEGSIWSARSSSFDEPLTPANFNLKDISTQGAAAVNAVKIDTSVAFVQGGGTRVYEASYDGGTYDYSVAELTGHVPEIGEPGIVRMAVQRQPETRIHCIRSDGTVALLTFDKQEEVSCWTEDETDGFVEDVCVLPGAIEDKVYYTVRRTVNGSTVRYHERHALESECQGGTLNRQADSFGYGFGSSASITGLSHLEGKTVVCWADGLDKGEYVVAGGSIPVAYSQGWVAGLPYEARYKSTKLAYGLEQEGATALCEKKRIAQLGIIAHNMHYLGLQYGPDFVTMDDMPTTEKYDRVEAGTVWSHYDEETFPFPGEFDTDSRLCLRASAPRPVTVLAAVIALEVYKK